MKQKQQTNIGELGFHERLQQELSTYPAKTIHIDGSVTIEQVNNPYFLINDKWNINFLGEIKQFEENVATYKYSSKNVTFRFINPKVNLEVKYVYYQRLFNDYWTINSIFGAQSPLKRMTEFLNQKYPTLSSLLDLKIDKVEREYLFWLNEYSRNNLKRKDTHPERYVLKALNIVGKFLEDIQRYEYDIAPETHVRLLLFPEDKPKLRKKSIDQIDYIPDYVLEQLFTHINDLPKDVIPVVWVAFKTGLRISDVLGLTTDRLIKLNGKYSIMTDIEKTYVQGHRIPIDEELANLLAVLIQRAKENSNQDNNPEGFIFIRYRGSRKGKPFGQSQVLKRFSMVTC
ncbi:integrase [Bacillus fengqiuensis]|nr:integrase [Bacillus fengqiuensis]